MFPTLQAKLDRFEELEQSLQDPEVLSNSTKLVEIQREYGGLRKVAEAMRQFHALQDDISVAEEMLESETDSASRDYAQSELDELQKQCETLSQELEDIVISGDSITRGGLIMEIRAGTGGDEAALFAGDLYNMYSRFVEERGWKMEIMESHAGEMGGFKEIVFSVAGEGAFHQLQFESGGHRVQRVPETETRGRIHTSAATVAVLPEATEFELEIRDEDLKVDTMRAGGPGGQKVNKTESAVRITHIPTGIVVKCRDEKSQHKNRAKAMRVLRGRILEAEQARIAEEKAEHRRTLVGSGDRSDRIRTYNFPQGRVTDHRIGLTLYKIDQIMLGQLDELIDAMLQFDREEKLRGGTAN